MSISEKRLAANRANAQRSTGPRTSEGKARASQNARRHGFRASTFAVVRLEELDETANLREDLIALYQPINSQEIFAVERIALAQQSILRAARLEAGLFTACLNEALDPGGEELKPMTQELIDDVQIVREQNRNYILAEGFHRIVKSANSWSLFLRYQAQAERNYRRAVEEFERLKALRPELPNEPTNLLPGTAHPPLQSRDSNGAVPIPIGATEFNRSVNSKSNTSNFHLRRPSIRRTLKIHGHGQSH